MLIPIRYNIVLCLICAVSLPVGPVSLGGKRCVKLYCYYCAMCIHVSTVVAVYSCAAWMYVACLLHWGSVRRVRLGGKRAELWNALQVL